jgi:uncharacterized protein YbjT (DUF2867 family)
MTTLVFGATGTVGGATLHALAARDAAAIAFVRDAARARERLGDSVEIRIGDLDDPSTIRPALVGIDRVLLCSGHDPAMRTQQLAVLDAVATSDVRRVVKISASPVAVEARDEVATGHDHVTVEDALNALGREGVVIRPNAFMQNFLEQAGPLGHGALPGPAGEPCVSFVDARDVGEVAAVALTADATPAKVLEVTGPEAFSWFDVAEIMSDVLERPITHYPTPVDVIRTGLSAMGRPDWLIEHTVHMSALMGRPAAARVTDTIARLTGRPPRTLRAFLQEQRAAFPAA